MNPKSLKAAREYLAKIKSVPCPDCIAAGRDGIWPPECMDFDHILGRGPKLHEIGDLVFYKRFELLEAELAKCEVICSNCHRIRTRSRTFAHTSENLRSPRQNGEDAWWAARREYWEKRGKRQKPGRQT